MKNIQPLAFFKEITAIPRDSGDEKAIGEYLLAFAESRGLEACSDQAHNVVIRKPGAKGKEKIPALVLQAHTDMVYVKSDTSDHDYRSPLELVEENSFLRANGTTLGADNGIGVAYALALLDSTDIEHPPLEALFTTGEEIGMIGATYLTPDTLQGRRLINLDSEEEGVFTVGCAGGTRSVLTLRCDWEAPDPGCAQVTVAVSGLMGGHSGMEIDRGRGNAIRLLARVLYRAVEELGARVALLDGGGKMNAIPDRASTQLALPASDLPKLREIIRQFDETFKAELSVTDPGVGVTLTEAKQAERVLHPDCLERILALLLNIPNGVQSMSPRIPGLVESSNNIGILFCEGDAVVITCALRSMVGSLKYAMRDAITLLAAACDAEVVHDSDYPEWNYAPVSPLRDTCVRVFKEIYGSEPKLEALHAGMECGYFSELYDGMDIISIGPNIRSVHTPLEMLDLASCERTWQYLRRLVEQIL